MKNDSAVAASLFNAGTGDISTVPLRPNANGQLPVVLIDPLDIFGQVVPGLWLSSDADDTAFFETRHDRGNNAEYGAMPTLSLPLKGREP